MNQVILKSNSLKTSQKTYALGSLIIPVLGILFSIPIALLSGISSINVGILILMTGLIQVGVEVGFHRLFAHRAFQTHNIVKVTLAILGCMAGQGPVTYWVAYHRAHHQYSDRSLDPHSPHLHGNGIRNRIRGLWHAHIGWLFALKLPKTTKYAKDLLKDPVISKVNKHHIWWMFIGLVIPAVLGGVLTSTWTGALSGLYWGGIVRLFFSQHSGYIQASMCHTYGGRPFETGDQSTNVSWLVFLTFGGSLHNNHHAFSNSAKFGLQWWQVDPGYWVIRALEVVGLAWDVKVPTARTIKAKKILR